MFRTIHLPVHFNDMKKIVVLGSNSFSGSDFIDLLLEKQKYHVIGISRSAEKSSVFLPYKRHKNGLFRFYQLDLNTDIQKIISLLQKARPDYIVNFAAQSEVAPSWEHPEHWFQTNVVSLAKLGNYLKDVTYLKRYVHISSPEVYGSCQGNVKENAPLNPSTPYAASKAAADLFLFTLVKNFNFPLVMIRSTNVYGAHQQLFKIIPRAIISIKLGKEIGLHGGGKAIKSYIHIRDISRGEFAALEKGKNGQIYHLSPDDKGIVLKDVIKIICKQMDVPYLKTIKVVEERLGQDKAYIIDSTKARKYLGWEPKVTLQQGIQEVIDWIDQNWTVIKNYPHEYIHKA
jgi:dTDP-glucose 4,6-dehydratase